MNLRANLIEIFERTIKLITSDKIYTNDIDNLYPNRVEGIINNSPTAYKCADIFSRFLNGMGLEDPTANVIVNHKKNYKVTDVINLLSKSISVQNGAFIHFNYGIDFLPNEINVLDYKKCRISKIDDNGYSGKIVYKDWSEKASFTNKKKAISFYPYNPNKDVILAQMKSDSPKATTPEELVKGYSGQVYYLNLTPQYQYALSIIDSVYNDADSEYRFGIYINKQFRSGFQGKTAVITKGVDAETDERINAQLKSFLGAENSDSLWRLTVEGNSDIDLEKAVVFKQLPSQFNDKLVVETKKQIQNNIIGAYNNIPGAFVGIESSSLFGDGALKYNQMKDFYSEQTAYERLAIENVFKLMNLNIKIKPITGELSNQKEINLQNKLKAQNELKSSVGGVNSLVTLVQNVANNVLDLESAVNILIEIYGFEEVTARKLIGTPNTITQ